MSTVSDQSPEFHPSRTNLLVVWLQVVVWLAIGGTIVWAVASSAIRFEDTLTRVTETEKDMQNLKTALEAQLRKAKEELPKQPNDVATGDVPKRLEALEKKDVVTSTQLKDADKGMREI